VSRLDTWVSALGVMGSRGVCVGSGRVWWGNRTDRGAFTECRVAGNRGASVLEKKGEGERMVWGLENRVREVGDERRGQEARGSQRKETGKKKKRAQEGRVG